MEAQKLTYNFKVVPKYVSSVTTDHLGSICQIIKPDGTVVEKTNYDPWGRVRNADTWTYPTSESASQSHALTTTYRGYTGHEHLPHFALINMNGRMYDPVVGRMLSPDNYVQSPNNPQNYNRYAYCLNNPLKYTDPNGQWINFVIGGIVGGVSGYMIGVNSGAEFGSGLLWYTLGGAAIGTATSGIGTAVAGSAGIVASGIVGGAASGAGFGTMQAYANGFRGADLYSKGVDGMLKGALSGMAGGIFGGAIGGGLGAVAAGMSSNLTSQLLVEDRGKINWKSAGVSGALSFGIYHATSYTNWRTNVKNQNFYGRSLKYNQYLKIQASYTRGKFWNSEKAGGGFWLTKNGISRQGVSYDKNKGNIVNFDYSQKPDDAWATFHPHPYNENQVEGGSLWHSTTDLNNVENTRTSSFIINKHGAELATPISTHYIEMWGFGKPYFIFP